MDKPPELKVGINYWKWVSERRLEMLKRAKAMLEIGMPHVVELIEDIEKELANDNA